MDSVTLATAAITYFGVKDMLPKLLGPSFDYLGGEVKSYTEKGVNNVLRIFANAGEKVGPDIENPKQVHPKVLKEILDEGYCAEDPLATEYFGGVLASSRTSNARDDRGAAFVKLVGQLSSYQLRAHHVIYMTARGMYPNVGEKLYLASYRQTEMPIYIEWKHMAQALDLNPEETANFGIYTTHILSGLARSALIEDWFASGSAQTLHDFSHPKRNYPDSGLIMQPSVVGAELFLWAYGLGSRAPDLVFAPAIDIRPIGGIEYPPVTIPPLTGEQQVIVARK